MFHPIIHLICALLYGHAKITDVILTGQVAYIHTFYLGQINPHRLS